MKNEGQRLKQLKEILITADKSHLLQTYNY